MNKTLAITLSQFVTPVLAGMGIFAALLCTLLLILSGFKYITSAGNVGKMESAKRSIIRSLIGLVIIVGAASISMVIRHAYGPVSIQSTQHLPSLSAVKAAPTSGGLVDILIKAVTGFLDAIIQSASKPFINALQYFTKGTPLLSHNSSVMHLWIITVAIADSLLALVVALLGFHIMSAEHLGFREFNLRALLPQLLLAVALINMSIYLLDGFIELSNVMIAEVYKGMGSLSPWKSLLAIVNDLNGFSLAALLIYVIFLIFTVILLVFYIGRIVVLYVGGVLAPLVVLLWLIPSFKDFAENTLKSYLITIYVLFVHVIILALAGSLFAAVNTSNGIKDPIMSMLLGLSTLVLLIKTQGVLSQLNYSSLGPKAVRNLGGSFVNGLSYVGSSAKYALEGALPTMSYIAGSEKNYLPESKSLPVSKLQTKKGKKK